MKSLINSRVLQRHYFFMMICFVFISSCSKRMDDIEMNNANSSYHEILETKSSGSEEVDFRITRDMVQQYLNGFNCYKDSIESITSYPSESNCLLFLVSFNDGWIVFPSDSRFGVVLAESDEGTLNLTKELENENLNAWLADIMKQIEDARDMLDSFGEESVEFWNTLKARNKSSFIKEIEESQVTPTRSLTPGEPIWGKVLISTSNMTTIIGNKEHLLQTKWGQRKPWNNKMPVVEDTLHCLAGCAAVAVAQVLYYYHYYSGVPSGMYHSITLTQFNSNESYDLYDSLNVHHVGYYQTGILNRSNYVLSSPHWAEMPLTNMGGTDAQYRYVSDLLLDVGVRLGTFYSPWGSFVHSQNGYFDLSSCFSSANWKQYQNSADTQTVLTGLDMNEPTIINSTEYGNGEQAGHVWVIDGYQKKHHYVTRIYAWYPIEDIPDNEPIYEVANENHLLSIYPDLVPGLSVISHSSYNETFFRMNWGANGLNDNSLYSSTATTPWLGVYSSNKGIHYHFFPEELIIQ